MKLHNAIVLVPMFLVADLKAQNSWVVVPSGTTATLRTIEMNTVPQVIAGDSGILMTSGDDGLTWAPFASGTSQHLRAQAIGGLSVNYIVGDSGTILQKQGVSTVSLDLNDTTQRINGVADHTSTLLTIVGDDGFVARNNGVNFTFDPITVNTTDDLFKVEAMSGGGSEGLIAGANGTLLRTTDNGLSWVSFISGTTEDLLAIELTNGPPALVVGANGTIIRSTTNGIGTSWTTIPSPVTSHLNAVARAFTGTYIAVGDGGTIIRSTDNGITWLELVSGTTEDLHGIGFRGPDIWVAVGANGTILRSTDNGGSGVGITEMGADPSALSAAVVNGTVQVTLNAAGALNGQLRMFDMRGREVMEPFPLRGANGLGGIQLPVPGSIGLYTVVAQVDGRRYSTRFLHLDR